MFHLSHLYLRINLELKTQENFKVYGRLLFHQTMNYIKSCHSWLSFEQWQKYLKPIQTFCNNVRQATILTELINLKLDISKTDHFLLARKSIESEITDKNLKNKLETQLINFYCS